MGAFMLEKIGGAFAEGRTQPKAPLERAAS
jgi:hypothetical protein